MRTGLVLLLSLATASPSAARETLGWYGHWGAFRDGPARCFARVAPSSGRGGLVVSAAPGTRVRVEVHVDLPRQARSDGLSLSIAGRRFALTSSGLGAWPATPRADLAVLAALRMGRSAELRGVDQNDRRLRASFPLAGAPSAIDAALIGCLPR